MTATAARRGAADGHGGGALRAAAIAVLLTTAGPSLAHADVEAARAAFEEGVALLDARRYGDAVAAFERSVEAHVTGAALYNLGLAHRGAGHVTDAIAAFERFLALEGANEGMRADAAAIIDELRGQRAELVLVVRGAPDEVLLDGEPVTPGRLVLDPGDHLLLTRLRGHADQRRAVTMRAGITTELSIDAAAEPLAAELEVEVTPAHATIRVDGVPRGEGRASLVVEPGEHHLAFAAAEHEPHERTLSLSPGARERVAVMLEPRARRSRWWIGLVAGVVVAAGVIALGIALSDGPGLDGGNTDTVLYNPSER